jgi:hypothetical protein
MRLALMLAWQGSKACGAAELVLLLSLLLLWLLLWGSVFERDGVAVVCDPVSLDFLKGAVVEYEDSLMRSAFQVPPALPGTGG